jgi:hypothetical protein
MYIGEAFLTNAYYTKCMPNARNAQRKAIHMLQRSSHTQSSQTTGSSRGGKKGLDTTGKRAKKHKNHKLPLNTCNKAKEHTKLTLHT